MATALVDQVGPGGAVAEGLPAEGLDVFADDHRAELHPQYPGELFPRPHQLPGNPGRLTAGLLHEHPDSAKPGNVFPALSLLIVDLLGREPPLFFQLGKNGKLLGSVKGLQGAARAGLDALAAADALLQDNLRLPRLAHLDAVHRADALAAGAAGDALSLNEADLAAGLLDRFFGFGHTFPL